MTKFAKNLSQGRLMLEQGNYEQAVQLLQYCVSHGHGISQQEPEERINIYKEFGQACQHLGNVQDWRNAILQCLNYCETRDEALTLNISLARSYMAVDMFHLAIDRLQSGTMAPRSSDDPLTDPRLFMEKYVLLVECQMAQGKLEHEAFSNFETSKPYWSFQKEMAALALRKEYSPSNLYWGPPMLRRQFGDLFIKAIRNQMVEVVCFFLKGGMLSDIKPGDKLSTPVLPLHEAARSCEPLIVDLLLEHGVPVDDRDPSDKTPLHFAAGEDCEEAVMVLLAAGAQVDVVDEEGWTPLMYAAVAGNDSVVKILGQRVQRLDWKNHKGETAMDLVSVKGHRSTAKVLHSMGASLGGHTRRR